MLSRDQINQLLDTTIWRLKKEERDKELRSGRAHWVGFREYQIFVTALGDTPEARWQFYQFLHDVATCPPEVLLWCQDQLRH